MMKVNFGFSLLMTAAGTWAGEWLWGAQNHEHSSYLAFLAIVFIAFDLVVLGACAVLRRAQRRSA